jgi:hypothetical protein
LHLGLGDVVSDGGHSEDSALISFLGDIPEAILIGPAQIVIRTDFMLIGFPSDALAGIPLVTGYSHSEDVLGGELLLPQIGRQSELVLLPVHKVMQVGLDEDGLLDVVAVGLRVQHLLDLVMHGVLLHLPEPEVSRVHWPVVRPLLLLSGIVVLMRFKVLQADLFLFGHVLPGVDGVLHSVLVQLGGHSVPEVLALRLSGQSVPAVDGLGEGLPLERVVLALFELLHEIAHAFLMACLHDIPNSLGLLRGDAVGEDVGREGIVDGAVVMLHGGGGTMVTPNCSL